MNPSSTPLRRLGAAAVAVSLSAGLLSGLAVSATAAPAASGPDWTATAVSGGVQVTFDPATPLPIVSDAPTLVVNGEDAGLATEGADGSLSVVVPGADADDIVSVEQSWASGDRDKVAPTSTPVTADPEAPVAPSSPKELRALAAAAADGSEAGPYAYVEDDYDFGDQAIDLASIGGIRGEMTGRIYLPTTGGARPTVILLHGRHSSCTVPAGGGTVSNPARWPCIAPQVDIPSYKGYDTLGQTLATQGYAVVSIAANAINSNDNQLAPDNGAQARGQLVLDSLEMLRKASAGEAVSFYDAARKTDVDLATALTVDTAAADLGTPATGSLTPADLVGRFDLTNVGLMGHSRGGEGVVSAVTLNQALAKPFGIRSVLPLAPVDFGRMTVADTPMLVMLPYCDGDVSNQQGQHFSDDSRRAFGDSVLRSTVWVMGANHNFFNTVWTPGKYSLSTSDDWGANSTDAVCGPASSTNQRLSADEQYATGVAVMAAWFRLALGDETALLPMFDGTTKASLSSVPDADLRTIATAPAAGRRDLATFESVTNRVRTYGTGSLTLCASASGRTLPQQLPACATAGTVRSTSAMPHWTPANYGPNVPATPVSRFLWTSATGEVRVLVPAGQRDASSYETLSFATAPDESVVSGTDMTVSVLDGSGHQWSSLVSALNPYAVTRMPISGSTTLNKIVLQQVSIPLASLGDVDLKDVREIRLTAATGADATATGGAYLSDLQLSRSGVGTPVVAGGAPTIGVAPTSVEEGAGADEKQAAVVLSKPAATRVSGWFSLLGSTVATSKAALAVQQVTFEPGQTCVPVTVPTYGDTVEGTTASTAYKMSITVPNGIVTGDDAFAYLTVREDDGTTAPSGSTTAPAPAPEVGVQGDVCAEYAARSVTQPLAASATRVAPGSAVTLTGAGYRAGESVAFSDGTTVLGSAVAGTTGAVTWSVELDPAAELGPHAFTALGAGSGRTSAVTVEVANPAPTPEPAATATATSVTLGAGSTAYGTGTTGTVVVNGVDTGTATVAVGSTSTTVALTGGTGTFAVPASLGVGTYSVVATYAGTTETQASTSVPVTYRVTTKATSLTLRVKPRPVRAGRKVKLVAKVSGLVGSPSSTVTFRIGGKRVDVAVVGDRAVVRIVMRGRGSKTVKATYAGDADHAASKAKAKFTVVRR